MDEQARPTDGVIEREGIPAGLEENEGEDADQRQGEEDEDEERDEEAKEARDGRTADRPDAAVSFELGIGYWHAIAPDVDGMLGGFGRLHDRDLAGSRAFVGKLTSRSAGFGRAMGAEGGRGADCGAGIGRITKSLLLPLLDIVDVVEPVKKFTDQLCLPDGVGTQTTTWTRRSSREHGNGDSGRRAIRRGRIGEIINVGLQQWRPARDRYALIWIQWCVGHLRDEQLVALLRRCGQALVDGGMVVLKENHLRVKGRPRNERGAEEQVEHEEEEEQDCYDELDSSVTRTRRKLERLIEDSGMVCFAAEQQTGFPDNIYPVRMFAIRPRQGPTRR